MFLDEELLLMCKKADLSNADDIQKLNADLCRKCEDYYKSKLHLYLSNKDIKVNLDKTFNLWDSFVRMAIKEGGTIKLLGELFKEHSFKKQLLSNKGVLKVYNSI